MTIFPRATTNRPNSINQMKPSSLLASAESMAWLVVNTLYPEHSCPFSMKFIDSCYNQRADIGEREYNRVKVHALTTSRDSYQEVSISRFSALDDKATSSSLLYDYLRPSYATATEGDIEDLK